MNRAATQSGIFAAALALSLGVPLAMADDKPNPRGDGRNKVVQQDEALEAVKRGEIRPLDRGAGGR